MRYLLNTCVIRSKRAATNPRIFEKPWDLCQRREGDFKCRFLNQGPYDQLPEKIRLSHQIAGDCPKWLKHSWNGIDNMHINIDYSIPANRQGTGSTATPFT